MKKNTYIIFTIKKDNKYYCWVHKHHNNNDLLHEIPKDCYNITIMDTKKQAEETCLFWNRCFWEQGKNIYD